MKDGALSFHVPGIPSTQGSKKAFVVKTKTGHRAVMKDDTGEALASWRETVRSEARKAAGPDWQRLEGPVAVTLAFGLKAPKSLPKRRRVWPIGQNSGDVDKLTRAVFDSFTQALLWRDDAQCVQLIVSKDYADPGREGMVASLRPINGGEPLSDPVRSTIDVRTPAGGLTLTGDPLLFPPPERTPAS
jgi:Holliday junction resolvase RusA-like endonuclease